MSFKEFGLHDALLESLSSDKYNAPTEAQQTLIPRILQGDSFIQYDNNMAGKTLGYLLPVIHRIYNDERDDIRGARIVILTSRRDRISQINRTLKSLNHPDKNIRIGFIVSGRPYQPQMRLMRRPLDVMLATPGRLSDLFRNNNADFSNLELLIVDDFAGIKNKNLDSVCQALVDQAKQPCQTLFFARSSNDVEAIQAITPDTEVFGEAAEPSPSVKKNTNSKGSQTKNKQGQGRQDQGKQDKREAPKAKDTQPVIDLSGLDYLSDGKLSGVIADDFTHKMAMIDQLLDEKADTRCLIYTSTAKEAESLTENIINHGHDVEYAKSADDITDDTNVYVISDKALIEHTAATPYTLIHYDLPRQAAQFFNRMRVVPAEHVAHVYAMIQSRDYHSYKSIEKQLQSAINLVTLPGLEALNPLVAPPKTQKQRGTNKQGQSNHRKPRSNDQNKQPGNKNTSNKNAKNNPRNGKNNAKTNSKSNGKAAAKGQNKKQSNGQGGNGQGKGQRRHSNGGRGMSQPRSNFNQQDEWISSDKEKQPSKNSTVVIQHKTKKKLMMND